jgi:zinc/manganese transport system substrate-binding protein
MKLLAIPVLLLAALASTPAQARLNVFACEPEWGALVTELAGDKVDLDVATTALQDVHVIEARPSLIAKVRGADLVVCTGAELEIGWLPQLIRQSGNDRVASGAGSFMAASQVKTLERPGSVDRANGDVHPEGNPHVQMDPRRVLIIARRLDDRLAQLDPANAAVYRQRGADFEKRWLAAMVKWKKQAAPLKGRNVVVHHISWVYLWDGLGMHHIGALAPTPGVPPTAAHMSQLVAKTKASNTLAIIRAAYQDAKPAEWLSDRTGVPAVALPFSVGGDPQSKDLFGLFDSTISRLLDAAR